ncbi:hypothetical protein TL16_g09460 [Triparma laevis f. inornata]|uniref:N-acetyltransferase domain-containing protein n=1 Tax=Triparma laevis f. inornata TaxID=1714386 RepID=A0A9W7EJB1_9STRA|nr:hypothetical protein TL16_g09460 [Triparma laevis f. inornata]
MIKRLEEFVSGDAGESSKEESEEEGETIDFKSIKVAELRAECSIKQLSSAEDFNYVKKVVNSSVWKPPEDHPNKMNFQYFEKVLESGRRGDSGVMILVGIIGVDVVSIVASTMEGRGRENCSIKLLWTKFSYRCRGHATSMIERHTLEHKKNHDQRDIQIQSGMNPKTQSSSLYEKLGFERFQGNRYVISVAKLELFWRGEEKMEEEMDSDEKEGMVITERRRFARCSKPGGFKFGNGDLKAAVREWYCEDSSAAEDKYGPISGWDVSVVTDIECLFSDYSGHLTDEATRRFNADISR